MQRKIGLGLAVLCGYMIFYSGVKIEPSLYAQTSSKKSADKKAPPPNTNRKKTPQDERDKEENEKKKITKEEDPKKRAENLELLKEKIRFASSTERQRSIKLIRELKPEEKGSFYPLLIEFVTNDRDVMIRDVSITTLADEKVMQSEDAILKALTDKHKDVRMSAVSAVGKLKFIKAAPIIDANLRGEDFSKDDNLTSAIIRTLGKLEYKESQNFLQSKLESPLTMLEYKRAIVLYYGYAKCVEQKDALLKLASDNDKDQLLRAYAINALGKFNDTSVVGELKKLYQDILDLSSSKERIARAPMKMQLIQALITLGDDSVAPDIIAAAKDDDVITRLRAIHYMGRAKMKSAAPLLKYKAKYDPSKRVRSAAEEALLQIEGKAEVKDDVEEESKDIKKEAND